MQHPPFTLRFAVTEGDQVYSTVWRMWTGDNGLTLMIANRGLADQSKITIHLADDSRHCHFATTRYYREKMRKLGVKVPEHHDELQWFRYRTLRPGAVLVCNIIIPQDMTHPLPFKHDKKIYELPRCGEGKAWVVSTYFTYHSPLQWPIEWRGTHGWKLLGFTQLATDELAVITARIIDFDAKAFWQRHEPLLKNAPRSPFMPPDATLDDDELLRGNWWNDPNKENDNVLRVWDVGGLKAISTSS